MVNDSSNSFYFSGFYGNPNVNDRYLSWDLIDKIHFSHSNNTAGWIMGGGGTLMRSCMAKKRKGAFLDVCLA